MDTITIMTDVYDARKTGGICTIMGTEYEHYSIWKIGT